MSRLTGNAFRLFLFIANRNGLAVGPKDVGPRRSREIVFVISDRALVVQELVNKRRLFAVDVQHEAPGIVLVQRQTQSLETSFTVCGKNNRCVRNIFVRFFTQRGGGG